MEGWDFRPDDKYVRTYIRTLAITIQKGPKAVCGSLCGPIPLSAAMTNKCNIVAHMKTSSVQPARAVNSLGPKSRAGLIA